MEYTPVYPTPLPGSRFHLVAAEIGTRKGGYMGPKLHMYMFSSDSLVRFEPPL